MKFKPYTLRDYKTNYEDNSKKYTALGGLGANKDTKNNKAIEQALKIRFYSSLVREKNKDDCSEKMYQLLHFKVKDRKKNNSRLRALEFAK